MPSCVPYQVMWTRRLRRSFLSTCSLEQGLALDLPLSLLPEVAPVPPPPMENLLHPADLAVEHSPPDHHKVNTALSKEVLSWRSVSAGM